MAVSFTEFRESQEAATGGAEDSSFASFKSRFEEREEKRDSPLARFGDPTAVGTEGLRIGAPGRPDIRTVEHQDITELQREAKFAERKAEEAGSFGALLEAGIEGPSDAITGLVREIFTRPGARLALTFERFRGFEEGGRQGFVPETPLERFFLGEEEVVDFQTLGEETAQAFGASEETAKSLAIPLGIAFGALDFFPPGKPLKNVIKVSENIAKTRNVDEIATELKNVVKGSDEDVRKLAEGFRDAENAKEIENILINAKRESAEALRLRQDAQSIAETGFKPLDEAAVETEKRAIDNLALQREFQEEALEQMPGAKLVRFKSRKEGEFLDSSLTPQAMRAAESAFEGTRFSDEFDNPDVIRQAIREFEETRDALRETKETLAQRRKNLAELRKESRAAQKERNQIKKRQRELVKRSEIKTKTRDDILTKLRTTQGDVQGVKDAIVSYVKANLKPKDRGRFLNAVARARTQRDLTKTFLRADNVAEQQLRFALRGDILQRLKRISKSDQIAVDYKDRIAKLFEGIDLKKRTAKTRRRLDATKKFLANEAEKGRDVELPQRVIKALETLQKRPFEEVTSSQLQGALAELELLEHLGRTKISSQRGRELLQQQRIIEEIGAQGAKPLKENDLIRPEVGERLTFTQKMSNIMHGEMNRASRLDKALLPVDVIMDMLDGARGTYDGIHSRFFKGVVDTKYGRWRTRSTQISETAVEKANKLGLEKPNFERIGVVAAREQDGGTEKLLKTLFPNAKTPTEIAEATKKIEAVSLSKEEQEMLDHMRSVFDEIFPEVADTARRVFNQKVEKVNNYFSFMTDWKAADQLEVQMRFGSDAPDLSVRRKSFRPGLIEERTGGEQAIKIDAMEVFQKHIDNATYMVEMSEHTKVLRNLVESPEYVEAVGEHGALLVREWVQALAEKGGITGSQQIRSIDWLRKNIGIGVLGLKLSTVAIQPTAIFDGMGFVGAEWVSKGVGDFASSKEWRDFVLSMPEIKDRLGGEFALRELTDDSLFQSIQRKGFIPLQFADQITAGMTAAGAYQRKMAELGKAVDFSSFDDEALAYAQLAVRRTQSSGAFKDIPLAVSRGVGLTGNRSVNRALLQFQNFLLTRWSRIRYDALQVGITERDPAKAIGPLAFIALATLAASGARIGANSAVDFVTGEEEEDTIAEQFKQNMVFEATGNVPFLGNIMGMALYDSAGFPVMDVPRGVIQGGSRIFQSESPEAKVRGFAEFAGSVGAILGVPGSIQAQQLVRGAASDERGGDGSGLPDTDLSGTTDEGGLPDTEL